MKISQLLPSQKDISATAFVWNGQLISYAKFYFLVQSLSKHLRQSSKIKWALSSDDTFLFAIGFFALLCAKKIIVLPHNIKENTIKQINAEELLLDEEIIKNSNLLNAKEDNGELDYLLPKSANIIFYTSGSSGEPKEVVKTLHNLESEILDLQKLFNFKNSFFAATVSHQHIYGLLFRLLLPLSLGFKINSELTATIEEISNLSKRFSDITLISSPAFLKRLSKEDLNLYNFKNVKVFSSGGLLDFNSAEFCAKIFGDFPIEVLGSTETGGVAWRNQKDGELWNKFNSIEIKLGEKNCLMVKSPYINASNSEFIAMGDAAQLLDDKRFILCGRIDRIIKVEEKRISLDEIEKNLLKNPLVENCFATLLTSNKRQMIGIVIKLNKDGEFYLKQHSKLELNLLLRNYLLKSFEAVVIPRKWRYVAKIPLNLQGKIIKNEITKLFNKND